MKERAAMNNSFIYIKIPQVPLCVSYKVSFLCVTVFKSHKNVNLIINQMGQNHFTVGRKEQCGLEGPAPSSALSGVPQ